MDGITTVLAMAGLTREDERDLREESKKEREGFAGSINLWRLEAKKENGEAELRGIQVQQDHDPLHLWFGGFSGFSRLDGNDSVHPFSMNLKKSQYLLPFQQLLGTVTH